MARRYTKRRTRTKRRKGGAKWWVPSFKMPWTQRHRKSIESSWRNWRSSKKTVPEKTNTEEAKNKAVEDNLTQQIVLEHGIQADLTDKMNKLSEQMEESPAHDSSLLIDKLTKSTDRLRELNNVQTQYLNNEIKSAEVAKKLNKIIESRTQSNFVHESKRMFISMQKDEERNNLNRKSSKVVPHDSKKAREEALAKLTSLDPWNHGP